MMLFFKGVLGGGALTGYVGIRLETERKKRKTKGKSHNGYDKTFEICAC